ncbi:MAG: exosortase/archaeosortase family protein [Armatimonadota bacterium]
MSTNETKSTLANRAEKRWIYSVTFLAVLMYLPTFQYLWEKWQQDTQYSLAYLVPFVCGYFVWKKWSEAKKLSRDPSRWGLVIIVVAIILHLTGVILDVSGPSALSIILLILGGCIYFHGFALVKLMAFPLAYMIFMIPVPGGVLDRLGLPMQIMASTATASLLSLTGLEVVRAGIQLSVDGFSFEVAQACSGMSSLVALVGVTAVFAYITNLPPKLKWVLFFLALPIALIANIVRITSIALVGSYWNWEIALRIYHDYSSPLLFLAAIVILFFINWGFEWLSARTTPQSS